MRKAIISVTLITVVTGWLSHAKDEKLPLDARALLAKLAEFEKTEKENFERIVAEKRKQVVEVLAQQMERETKSGNLDGAIALRTTIASLQEAKNAPLSTETRSEAASEKLKGPPDKGWFVGRVWAVENAAQAYTFQEDGSVKKSVNGQSVPSNHKWTLMDSGALKVVGENSPMYFWIDSALRGEMTQSEVRVDPVKLERR